MKWCIFAPDSVDTPSRPVGTDQAPILLHAWPGSKCICSYPCSGSGRADRLSRRQNARLIVSSHFLCFVWFHFEKFRDAPCSATIEVCPLTPPPSDAPRRRRLHAGCARRDAHVRRASPETLTQQPSLPVALDSRGHARRQGALPPRTHPSSCVFQRSC